MGLASALTTALTGLTAAETQIDVVGNNLANSQTVGYKASTTVFATQFLQTLSLGSGPTGSRGGTNPRQTGLGTQVAEITPNFTQGTIEISSNASDLAIQGDGFFIVEGSTGEQLYTRNGIFKTNAENELVTTTGARLLGYGVDETFTIQATEVKPLSIPLGSAAVAQATRNVEMEGVLTPVGDIADTAAVIESTVLGDSNVPRPDVSATGITVPSLPDSSGVTTAHTDAGGALQEGQEYRYRVTFVDDSGTESQASPEIVVNIPVGNTLDDNQVTLNSLPTPLTGEYVSINVYRTSAGVPDDFGLLGTAAIGGSFTDNGLTAPGAALDDSVVNGNYSYLITFHKTGIAESRPSVLVGPQNVVNGRVQLTDLPTPPTPPTPGAFPEYDEVRIYRNLASDSSSFYLVETLAPGVDYTDKKSDAEISDLTISGNKEIDLDGPKVDSNTLLVNVVRRTEFSYENVFKEGQLGFTGRKVARQLSEKEFTITASSTVQELLEFMQDSMGIQNASSDPQNAIPGSKDNINPGSIATLSTGASIVDGKMRFVSNNGVDNAVSIGLSAFEIAANDGSTLTPNLGFGTIQEAVGQSTVTDFIVYDSLGIPINVRMTAVLENKDGSQTTYRWFADSPDNDPLSGTDIAVGTGLLTFDGEGNFITASNDEVSVERRNIPSASPLTFELNFDAISGLALANSNVAAARQDGSAPGTLSSFVIGEDGVLRGVFSNGSSRDLGAIRLARFANPTGLEQRGENLFAAGANSGLPVQNDAGQNGMGTIIAGAVELSNTDIGQNLIDLVLAQTQYRGNTRVISAAQQLLDELLSLRR